MFGTVCIFVAAAVWRVNTEVPQREGAAAAVERVVMETLEQIVDKGFTPLQLAAALNKTEFSLRECPRKSLPRGLVFTRQMSQEITFGKVPIHPKTLNPKP